jgi:hypothetical protein
MLNRKTLAALTLAMLIAQCLLAADRPAPKSVPPGSMKIMERSIRVSQEIQTPTRTASSNSAFSSPRLIPLGSVKLLESRIVMDKEIPVPAGMLMASTDQGYVEAEGLQLICADKTVFAVSEELSHFSIMVQEGNVDFALRADTKPIEFKTPFDSTSAKPYLIPASSDALVRGNLHVTKEKAVLTMSEGSLELMSQDGQKLIHAGNAIVLARVPFPFDEDNPKTPAPEATGTGSAAIGSDLIIGFISVSALTAGALALGSGGGGGGGGDTKEVTPH